MIGPSSIRNIYGMTVVICRVVVMTRIIAVVIRCIPGIIIPRIIEPGVIMPCV